MKYLFIILFTINLLFPSFKEFNHTYQHSLITNSNRLINQIDDIQFQIGPNFEEFKKWKRTYFGFPESPIVLDIQHDLNIYQCRIDTLGLLKT